MRIWIALTSLLILAVGVFFLTQRGIALDQIWKCILAFDKRALLRAFAFIVAQVLCQATLLWALVPGHPRPISWLGSASAFASGQVVNSLFPARAGEAIKTVGLVRSSQKQIGIATAAGMLIAEKAAILFCLILCVLFFGIEWIGEMHLPFKTLIGGFILFHLSLAGFALLLKRWRPALYLKIAGVVRSLLQGLAFVTRPDRIAAVLVLGVGSWLAEMVALQTLATAQGLTLSLSASLWSLMVLNLGIALPLSIANVGTFEAALAFGLSRYAVPEAQGLAIATVHHALQLLGIIGLALILGGLKLFFSRSIPKAAI